MRWLFVGLVVLVALVVAVWPAFQPAPAPTAAPPAPNLAPHRAAAALRDCASGTAVPAADKLSGVTVTCLGSGQAVDFGAVLAGGPALINVWATWCAECQAELPALETYAARPGAIRVVGVQVQSDQTDGLDLLSALHVHLPTVFDGSGVLSHKLRLPVGLPASYLVKPDGTAILVTQPRVFESSDQIAETVRAFLAGAG